MLKDSMFLHELKPKNVEDKRLPDPCMEGTREDIFIEIDAWIDDVDKPNILWLKGFPGTGKSAIAMSTMNRLTRSCQLGSAFFFERDNATQKTAASLWRFVASDLAHRYPCLRSVIVKRLRDHEVDPSKADARLLFEHLIEGPLHACDTNDIPRGRLPVVIIDALDECGGLEGPRSKTREWLLDTVARWSRLPPSFKLIITSRDEEDIRSTLLRLKHISLTLWTGSGHDQQTYRDIRAYLASQFERIAQKYPSLSSDWPGSYIIDELTEKAAGLFIWATTMIRFVGQGDPEEQLASVQTHVGGGDLYDLYNNILNTAFGPHPSVGLADGFKAITGAIILAKTPLALTDFSPLLEIKPTTLDFVRNALQPVLDPDGGALRFLHQSFVDFLRDPLCPQTFAFRHDAQSRKLAIAAVKAMENHLCFDICQFPSSYMRNDQVPDLDRLVAERIPSRLVYSCWFWADHVVATPVERELLNRVKSFLEANFLYWLEVMSITKMLGAAPDSLRRIAQWSMVSLRSLLPDQVNEETDLCWHLEHRRESDSNRD
jgi:hypothetical protein